MDEPSFKWFCFTVTLSERFPVSSATSAVMIFVVLAIASSRSVFFPLSTRPLPASIRMNASAPVCGALCAAAQSMQPSRLHTISTSAALRCTTRVNFHHPFLQNDFSMPAFTQILSLPFSC